jgi:HEAT repeat protein
LDICRRDWSAGKVDEGHVRDLLKCRNADVQGLEEFLNESYPSDVRWAAARVLMEKGQTKEVVAAAMLSQDRESILALLSLMAKQKVGLAALEGLVSSEDTMVRDAAVDMFRRAGKVDVIFPLIFDKDDAVVQRIKRYINEAAGQRGQTCDARRPA